MDFAFDSSKKYPLDFSGGLSLQALASTKLALRLWHDVIHNEVTHNHLSIWTIRNSCWFEKDGKFSCQEVLNVPTRIRDIIDTRIELVREELRIWLKMLRVVYTELFLGNKISNDNPDELISILFDTIVLKPDNTICFQRSASNALMNNSLNPENKYKIACGFCLEDCVRQLWPFLKFNFVPGRPLESYWNGVMRRGNDHVPSEIRYELDTLLVKDENTTAFSYLWNKLAEEQQVFLAVRILQNPASNYSTMKFLLAKLNEIQAKRVLEEAGDNVVCKVMEKDTDFEYTKNYWIYMKDFISGNIFSNIIAQLWQRVLHYSKLNIKKINRSSDLLNEIWITASDPLKASVLNIDFFNRFFASLGDQPRRVDYNNGMKFLFELLENANYELRFAVWLENWRKLIFLVGPSKLDELMRLCLANEEEIEQFKEHRMANFEDLEPYFSSRIEKKLIVELCQYLNFCVKNPRRLETLSKEIILSNLHLILSCDDENELAKFHSLIHCTFRDSQSANKFIEEMILAPEFLALIYSILDDGGFDEVISISGRFPTSERNLNEIKRKLVDYCRGNLARGQLTKFERQKFENFLCWCCLNETAISELKQSFSIDDIFEIIVNKLIQEGLALSHRPQTLLGFNHFLAWYFGSLDRAKFYKSSKVIHYEECEFLKIAFQQGNLEFVDRFLKWAFDDDINKIATVKSTLKNNRF